MAPKRKSDAIDLEDDVAGAVQAAPPNKENVADFFAKKPRLPGTDGADAEASTSKSTKPANPESWQDIVLEGDDEDEVPIYDDCNEVRRKIRLLQKTSGWKVTQWLKDIGNVNNNSYGRFMKASGPCGGAGNVTYYAAYVYFEKVRIFEKKKKTLKRERNEIERPQGLPRVDRSRQWVIVPRR